MSDTRKKKSTSALRHKRQLNFLNKAGEFPFVSNS